MELQPLTIIKIGSFKNNLSLRLFGAQLVALIDVGLG